MGHVKIYYVQLLNHLIKIVCLWYLLIIYM